MNAMLSLDYIFGVAALVLFLLYLARYFRTDYNLPPGPWGLPILGHLPFLGFNPTDKLEQYRQIYGGIFRIRFGRKPAVVLSDFNIIKDVYKMEGLTDRVPELNSLGPDYCSILEVNGKEWIDRRKFAVYALRGTNRERDTEDIIQGEIRKILKKVDQLGPSEITDVSKLIGNASNNIGYSILCGKDHSQNAPMSEFVADYVSKLMGYLQFIPLAVSLNIPNSLHGILLPPIKEGKKSIKEMDDYLCKEIRAHQTALDPNNPRDYIDLALLDLQKSENVRKIRSCEGIRNDCQIILLGAGETSKTGISWISLLLAKHQDKQERMYQDIVGAIGDRWPSHNDLTQLPYIEAFIMETLRYRTILPINLVRQPPRDIEVRGFDIQKNTWLLVNWYRVHNDPDLWKDPKTFNPDRFLTEDGDRTSPPEYWVPFSIGARMCPGDKVARMELFLMTVSLVQKYKIFPTSKGVSLEGYLNKTYQARYPFVRFEKRTAT